MDIQIQNLKILIKKFKIFTQTLNKNHSEFEILLQRYKYFKLKIQTIKRNGHYTDCTFSYKDSTCEKELIDYCSCYYIERFPENLSHEIIKLIGSEYIINF